MERYDMRMDGDPCGTLQVLVTKAPDGGMDRAEVRYLGDSPESPIGTEQRVLGAVELPAGSIDLCDGDGEAICDIFATGYASVMEYEDDGDGMHWLATM